MGARTHPRTNMNAVNRQFDDEKRRKSFFFPHWKASLRIRNELVYSDVKPTHAHETKRNETKQPKHTHQRRQLDCSRKIK